MFYKEGFLLISFLAILTETQAIQKRALYYDKTDNICVSDIKD